ncbi:MAG: hypothetical protein ACU833_14485 [Gammaproteobacteria bacterium]
MKKILFSPGTAICVIGSMFFSAATYAGVPLPCQAVAEKSLPGAPRPFIFNHAHIDNGPWWWKDGNPEKTLWKPQSVPVNSCVRIQLPAQPTLWKVTHLTINGAKAETDGIVTSTYPNQNRYIVPCEKAGIDPSQCPTQIEQFELNLVKAGTTSIGFTGTPAALIPAQLSKIQGGFKSYTLTLEVTE